MSDQAVAPYETSANGTESPSLIVVNVDERDLNYKTLQHLLQYEWANSGYTFFSDCKYVAIVSKETAPISNYLFLLKPAQKAVNWLDSFCDHKLTSVDQILDLSSSQIDDMTRLAKDTLEMIQLVTFKGMVEPTVKQINNVGALVHYLSHNDKGKSVIPSMLDPIVSPVNVLLEKAVLKKLPGTDRVAEQSSELKRSLKIFIKLVKNQEGPDEPQSIDGTSGENFPAA